MKIFSVGEGSKLNFRKSGYKHTVVYEITLNTFIPIKVFQNVGSNIHNGNTYIIHTSDYTKQKLTY